MGRRLLAAAALAAALAAGCSSETTGSALDQLRRARDDYLARADRVCLRAFDDIVRLPDPGSAQGWRAAVVARVDIYRDSIAELRSLTPPSGDERAVDDFLDVFAAELDRVEQDPQLLVDALRDPDVTTPLAETGVRAEDLGYRVCGQDERSV